MERWRLLEEPLLLTVGFQSGILQLDQSGCFPQTQVRQEDQ